VKQEINSKSNLSVNKTLVTWRHCYVL